MLSDKKLMKISLALSVIGVIALFFIVQFIEPKELSISAITQSAVGQEVITQGAISSYALNDGNIFIDLSDSNSTIQVVMFEQDAKNLNTTLVKGDIIKVTGKISLYKNEMGIIATKIEKL